MTVPQQPVLRGRNALVVGGSTGIGRGIADAWAAAGASVTVLSRSRPTGEGGDLLAWSPLDLSETGTARSALAGAAATDPELVCYSAVHYGDRRAAFGEVEEADWRRAVDVNLHGLWLTLRATLPSLRRAGGRGLFLGVSSEVVYNGGPGRSGYAATKAACAALLDSVAQEEADGPVRIVQVLPAGMVDTPGIRRRRASDFDYSGYMRPEHFHGVARMLALGGGAEHHGDSLVVDADGTWTSVSEQVPASQSRRTGA